MSLIYTRKGKVQKFQNGGAWSAGARYGGTDGVRTEAASDAYYANPHDVRQGGANTASHMSLNSDGSLRQPGQVAPVTDEMLNGPNPNTQYPAYLRGRVPAGGMAGQARPYTEYNQTLAKELDKRNPYDPRQKGAVASSPDNRVTTAGALDRATGVPGELERVTTGGAGVPAASAKEKAIIAAGEEARQQTIAAGGTEEAADVAAEEARQAALTTIVAGGTGTGTVTGTGGTGTQRIQGDPAIRAKQEAFNKWNEATGAGHTPLVLDGIQGKLTSAALAAQNTPVSQLGEASLAQEGTAVGEIASDDISKMSREELTQAIRALGKEKRQIRKSVITGDSSINDAADNIRVRTEEKIDLRRRKRALARDERRAARVARREAADKYDAMEEEKERQEDLISNATLAVDAAPTGRELDPQNFYRNGGLLYKKR